MVQHTNAQYLSSPAQPLRAFPVVQAGSRVSGWMVMQENESGSAVPYCRGKNFPGMNDGCAETADRHQNLPDQLVLRIEMQGYEIFPAGAKKLCSITLKQVPAVGEALTWQQGCGAKLPPEQDCGVQNRSLPGRHPSSQSDFLQGSHCQGGSGAEISKQPARRGFRCGAAMSPAQYRGNQGENLSALFNDGIRSPPDQVALMCRRSVQKQPPPSTLTTLQKEMPTLFLLIQVVRPQPVGAVVCGAPPGFAAKDIGGSYDGGGLTMCPAAHFIIARLKKDIASGRSSPLHASCMAYEV